MAEDFGDQDPKPGSVADAAALSAAFGAAGASEDARVLLREQTRLVRLQALDLEREDKLRHWSLRVRHISDVLKLAFELALALIFTALVGVIAAAIWSAAHDDGLVIDAFKVPPDLAARGLTGDVVASQLLDRLTQMQAETDSSRAPGTYASNWGDDIKVEIPDTGISIGEAYHYLAGWLGNQTHISGEIFRNGGGIALVTRVSGHASMQVEGRETDLNRLLKDAAENVYRQTQPYRYAVYLFTQIPPGQPFTKAVAVLQDLALNGPDVDKPWAYAVWALNSPDVPTMLSRVRKALVLDPDLPLAVNSLCDIEAGAGHDEQELAAAIRTQAVTEGPGASQVTPVSDRAMDLFAKATASEETGDYKAAIATYDTLVAAHDFEGAHAAVPYMKSAELAFAHDLRAARLALGTRTDSMMIAYMLNPFGWQPANIFPAQYEQYAAAGRWRDALASIRAALATSAAHDPILLLAVTTQFAPWLALAEAKTGDAKAALRDIAGSPLDCYLCLRVRAAADIAARNWNGAAYWFADAAKQAPSIPFADSEWGAMLLHRGQYDAAIARLEAAHAKGPHFADPLEMWGEALMLKNRSDLALAKFAAADKYAPNWGRLHLKWGEALLYSGDRDGAKKQLAIAAGLDLGAAERAELARDTRG